MTANNEEKLVRPLMDASQDAQAYRLLLDMPGVSQQDASVTAESGTLTIRGARGSGAEALTYMRQVRLPEDALVSDITASLTNGVLSVTVPRAEPVGPHVVNVQAA